MTVYVLRSDNLVKIGFSENIVKRVGAIVSATPVPVEFVGYMPGGVEVEKHLHTIFSATRFSGEWFVETPSMRSLFEVLLIKGLPAAPVRTRISKRPEPGIDIASASAKLRERAAHRWPTHSHAERVAFSATELGWNISRCRDVYYAARRASLRAFEVQELERWASRRLALVIAPELKAEENRK